MQASDRDNRILIALSLVIGVAAGLTVVGFELLTGRLSSRMYPADGAAIRRVLVPVFGSLISGYLLYRWFPKARGSGIPQTKFALFLDEGYISLRTVCGKLLCCSISLASGIALGREGPSVQIGAGISSVIGRRFGLSPAGVKALVPAGASAALAAAFNTPIAAVLFSLEEVVGNLHAPLGPVVLSSATSWIVLHLILGDEPLFHVPTYQLVSPMEFGIYALLGVAGGLASVCFVRLLLYLRIVFRRLPESTLWLQPVAGGLLIGLIGWLVPEVMGVGYDYVDRVLGGDFPLQSVLLFAGLKLIATPVCYSSGNAGGIFGPSLFIGAMLGGATGAVAHGLFPAVTANPGAYALVGMGTAFAGIIRTPLTSVIMIFEITRDYSIIVPLMISNLISFFVSQRLQREPIYEALARQEGVFLPSVEERENEFGIRAEDMMVTEPGPLPLDSTLALARAFLSEVSCNSWPAGESHRIAILLRASDVEMAGDGLLRDIVRSGGHFPHLHPDHTAAQALERMRTSGVDALPVVSRANIHQLMGVVTRQRILAAYGVE